MKKLLLPLALVAALMLAGCAKKDPIVGVWTGEAPAPGGTKSPVTMTFKEDKSFDVKMNAGKEVDVTGTWSLKEKVLSMTALKVSNTDIPKASQRTQTSTLSDDGKTLNLQGVTLTKQ